jgi:putative flippase GtrA
MKLVRYFLVGSVSAVIDLSIFGLCVKIWGLPWFPVAICSFVLATAVNYVLSVQHVFESGVRYSRRNEITLVFLVSAIGLVINQTALWVLIESYDLDELVSKVLASGSVFFWNYSARNSHIFKGAG